jgi:glutathione synthase/RimK-type ligase-like ATP-grasp enzyme
VTGRPLVLLATCAALPQGDPDDAGLIDALAEEGLDARWQVWDDPSADWTGGTTVLRSTWDYTFQRAEFLRWLVGLPAVHNPPAVVRWNSDKRYLLELASAGLPVTPTAVVEPGGALPATDSADVVVKPSVGAGSRGAGRYPAADLAAIQAHVDQLHAAGRTVLVQPYLDGVDLRGETAVIAFAGEISHAARKGPMLQEHGGHDVIGPSLFIEENITARDVSDAERTVAERALAFLADRFGRALLYTRIDLLPGRDGPVIVEVEAVEPSLFFGCSDTATGSSGAALARFAAAVARTVGGGVHGVRPA